VYISPSIAQAIIDGSTRIESLYSGYEADFEVWLVNKDEDPNFVKNLEPFGKEYTLIRKMQDPSRPFDPWIEGGLQVREDESAITEVTVSLVDPGVPTADGDIQYFWMSPGIISRLRGAFKFYYINFPDIAPKEFRGWLKEMRPKFRMGKPPIVEYSFQCSGYEFTRTVRNVEYPSIKGTSTVAPKETTEVQIQSLKKAGNPELAKSYDRTWAEVDPADPKNYLTLEEIFVGLLTTCYGYPIQWATTEDMKKNTKFYPQNIYQSLPIELKKNAMPPVVQSVTTDWAFMTQLAKSNGLSINAEPVAQADGSTKTTYVISELARLNSQPTMGNIEFWYPRMDLLEDLTFNPLRTGKWVIIDEPDVTVNSNWTVGDVPVPEVVKKTEKKEVIVDGKTVVQEVETGEQVVTFTEVDENNESLVYEMDFNKLRSPAADLAFKRITGGEWNFAAVKDFFIKNNCAVKRPPEDKMRNKFRFEGIEASFSTIGNPFVQVNKQYPVLGFGSYYSIGRGKSELSQDLSRIQEEKDAADIAELEKEKQAQAQQALKDEQQRLDEEKEKSLSQIDADYNTKKETLENGGSGGNLYGKGDDDTANQQVLQQKLADLLTAKNASIAEVEKQYAADVKALNEKYSPKKEKQLQDPNDSSTATSSSLPGGDTLKPNSQLKGLRIRSLSHTIDNGNWRTSYEVGM